MAPDCPDTSVVFNTHDTEHGWLEYFAQIDHSAAVLDLF